MQIKDLREELENRTQLNEEEIVELVLQQVNETIMPVANEFVKLDKTIKDGIGRQMNQNDFLIRRQEQLHGKVDHNLTISNRISEAPSTSTQTPSGSQQTVEELAPLVQHLINTTVLQQVTATVEGAVQRAITTFVDTGK